MDIKRQPKAIVLTLGLVILRYTIQGASEVLASCEGWFIVSQSNTTSCNVVASSKILSISPWTSERHVERVVDRSMIARFVGLFNNERLAKEISAITLVIIILKRKRHTIINCNHPVWFLKD